MTLPLGWALSELDKLSSQITELLDNPTNIVFVSTASLWELQIKKSLGKISLPDKFIIELQEYGYELLNITPTHILSLQELPLIHRDPFDRILIAQSKSENLPLITKDSEILKYDIQTIKF